MAITLDELLRLYVTPPVARVAWIEDVAQWLVDVLSPVSVLIVGEASAELALALRQRNVAAWGGLVATDASLVLSTEAFSHCATVSATEPFSQWYDLIVCVEALMPLDAKDAARTVANLCTHSSDILFAVRSPLYGAVDAPQPEHWAMLFMQQGFVHDLMFDATSLLPWAMRFCKKTLSLEMLAAHYERYLWRLERENVARRVLNLDHREVLVRLEGELEGKQQVVTTLQNTVRDWEARWAELERGVLWPWVQRLQRLRAWAMPPGSRRELWLEKLFNKRPPRGTQIEIAPVALPAEVQQHTEPVDVVVRVLPGLTMTQRSLEALRQCTSHPYMLVLVVGDDVEAETRSFVMEWGATYGAHVMTDNAATLETDVTYVARLDTRVLVTPHWLDHLITCAAREERLGAVGPLSNRLVLPDVVESTPAEKAVLVARVAGGECLPVSELPGECALFRRGTVPGNERRAGVCDTAYVHIMEDVDVVPMIPSSAATVQERVWLGTQARLCVARERQTYIERGCAEFAGRKLLFVLPVTMPGGGANIVISEAMAMRAMGVDVELFNLSENRVGFEAAYPGLQIPVLYGSSRHIVTYASRCDAVLATFNTSVQWLAPLAECDLVRGYYVQGFEPYIYKSGTPEFDVALASYTLFPDLVRFTKTDWTRREVLRATGADSWVIGPSIELDLFRPRSIEEPSAVSTPVRIAAMVRPFSAYRAPQLTMKLLRTAMHRYRDAVEVYLFGISAADPGFAALPRDFAWKLAGVLEKKQVARLLAMVDVFVDFSEHQAMGLTAMEAMACGNAVIVPQKGGAESFAHHEHNALVVDTASEKACWYGLQRLIEDRTLRERLRSNALRDIMHFYPERAAYNILRVLFAPEEGVEL